MQARSLMGLVILLGALCPPGVGLAQQPLRVFLRAAAEAALDGRRARLAAARAGSLVDEARGRLLPSVDVTGGYTRNEVQVNVPFVDEGGNPQQATITARDQAQATVRLNVPLVDVAAWSRFFAAESEATTGEAELAAVNLDVNVQVVRAYYRLAAARAVGASARVALRTAEQNLATVESRASAGLDSELSLARARADAARAEQAVAEADLESALAARQLEVLTGLAPDDADAELPEDLAPEPPLAAWMGAARRNPDVRAAEARLRASDRGRDASWQELLPVIEAFAQETYTNAPGFGPNFLWSVGVNATWVLDFVRPAAVVTERHVVDRQRVAYEQALLDAETSIHDAWHRVQSLVVRARAARTAYEASEQAARSARARYEAGTGTQLEVSQAERDLFEADVGRIEADADLATTRLVLRLESGLPPARGARP
ncbi:MAG: TolC family protein [Sandaracinaceae bacterium]